MSLLSYFADSENSEDCLSSEELDCIELLREQLLTAGVIININSPYLNTIKSNNNSKPIFCIMQDMGFFNINKW